jgi:hypothetical protein
MRILIVDEDYPPDQSQRRAGIKSGLAKPEFRPLLAQIKRPDVMISSAMQRWLSQSVLRIILHEGCILCGENLEKLG